MQVWRCSIIDGIDEATFPPLGDTHDGGGRKVARLGVVLQVPLEAAEQDFALAGLEAVHHGGDRALQVSA